MLTLWPPNPHVPAHMCVYTQTHTYAEERNNKNLVRLADVKETIYTFEWSPSCETQMPRHLAMMTP